MVEKGLKIKSIKKISSESEVYNLHVKDNHNYYANGLLVKNCHSFQAKSLQSIMEKLENCKYRYGFTGTLNDTQVHKLVLVGLFGAVNKVVSTKELMDQNYIAQLEIKIITLQHKDEYRKFIKGKTYQEEIDFITQYDPRNKFIKNLALSLQGNTLILFQFVDKHQKKFYNMIIDESNGRKIFLIHGGIVGEERDKIRNIVQQEKDSIIVATLGTFSTGVNIPNLHNVIFASPSKSKIKVLQSIGRSLRTTENKTNATLFDIADDFQWKKYKNYTLKHLLERIEIYNDEKFNYKIYNVKL